MDDAASLEKKRVLDAQRNGVLYLHRRWAGGGCAVHEQVERQGRGWDKSPLPPSSAFFGTRDRDNWEKSETSLYSSICSCVKWQEAEAERRDTERQRKGEQRGRETGEWSFFSAATNAGCMASVLTLA